MNNERNLSKEGLIQAFTNTYYAGQPWEPKAGDYYCIGRATEPYHLCKIVKIENGKLYTVMCDDQEQVSDWDEVGFTTENFGVNRIHVPEWFFKFDEFFIDKIVKEKEVECSDTPILWGFDGQEILTHDNEYDAIESWLEDISDGDHLPKTIKVNGYVREIVSDEFAKDCTEVATDCIHEKLMERYGYEDEIELNSDALIEFEKASLNLCKKFKSWSCTVVCTNEIDTKSWVMENRKDWIEGGFVTWETDEK